MNIFNFFILFLHFVSLVHGDTDDVNKERTVELIADTFQENIKARPHFVMFFAPWCGHCKRLNPTWEELAQKYNADSEVTIAKVDCTKHTAVCAVQEVNGYPTLKLFSKGIEGGIKYRGARDLSSLEKFIAEQLGLPYSGDDSVPEPVSTLVEFTDESFSERIHKGSYFIKFYAPWCGHCQRLAPTWDLLASTFEHDNSITIAKIDCTKYKQICTDFNVKGYPTLLWIVNGKLVEKYTGDRSHEDLKAFVMEQVKVKSTTEDLSDDNVSPVVTLTADNFENVVGARMTLVKFFAPWCGHCKRLAPTYDELGKKFMGQSQVTIAKVDCTVDINKELCSEQRVNGFPTLYLYKDGIRTSEYDGDRSLDDMISFIKDKIPRDEL